MPDTNFFSCCFRTYVPSLPKKYNKPVICLRFIRLGHDIMEDILREGRIPIYDTPDQCARAMVALVHYGRVRRKKDF